MMQHKFLLFSAVCCCLLQAILCGDELRLPPSAMFRPRFSHLSSFSTTSTSSAVSDNDLSEKLKQLGQPSAEASTTKKEDALVAPPAQTEPVPAAPTSVEESPSKEPSSSPKKKSSKALSKSPSKKITNPNDPLNISNIDQLKERAKELIRNVLKDENANRAITQLAINARDLLKNEVASNIILTHTHLIKDTLTNEEARDIIKDFRMDVARTFINKETPQKVQYAFEKSKECLSQEDLPKLVRKRFKTLKKILKNKKTYPAMVSLKNAIVKFVKTPDIKKEIAKGFKLLDFGIHFDPNNVMKSLGLPISFFK